MELRAQTIKESWLGKNLWLAFSSSTTSSRTMAGMIAGGQWTLHNQGNRNYLIFLTCHMSMLEDFDATCKHSQDSSIEKQSGAIWHSLKGKKRRLSHELDQHRHRWPDHRIHSKSPKMMHHLAPWIDWHLQHPKIKDNQFKTRLGGVAPWLPGPACSPNSSSSEKWAARAARMAT